MMGLQFMTGTPEIMTKYISILCLLLLINSCSRQLKGVDSNKAVKDIQLITNAYDINEDSLLVKALVLFPISNLVFIKQDSTFEASVEIIFRIENKDSELQIDRVSYNKKIIKESYNETRYEELYSFEHEFLINKNNCNLIVSIKDLDSHSTWDKSNYTKLNNKNKLILYHYNHNNSREYIFNNLSSDFDTIWFQVPKY